ncbi:hypothetical protein [Pseudomonas sp. BF-RE-29]|uniref:hypothetical protein n=1 Tax=Pseudomonas sp. BF-RE-29 TaxID=2832378 RepID=UPI001CC12929|nr:hypothetical protein [Pseudomonas sp. BF-RE-29]
MLKDFLFKRPDWFKHEGYWRLAQVFRLGPALLLLVGTVISLVFIFDGGFKAPYVVGNLLNSAGWFASAVVCLVVAHWLIRLIAWIIDGFKSGGT